VTAGREPPGVTIRELAPGKVNLCLFLGPARVDGRHELVTLFESVSLADELLIAPADTGVDEVVAVGVEGPNLVSLAIDGLRRVGWDPPPVRVAIEKRIPVAAGMGGGSADAAALLRVAPRLASVPADAVSELAAALGADVPAQLSPGVALGTGAGEIVSPRAPLAPHAFAIVPLEQPLATMDVYREADRLRLGRDRDELRRRLDELEGALSSGDGLPPALLVNDLEPAARSLCPRIDLAIAAVAEAGADHVMVCGSGPTVAGVYWGGEAEPRAAEAVAQLAAQFPRAAAAVPVAISSPS
jgi:4-diphosphocytidyl-2-C-methyl-D-erythritol kinase